MNSVMDNFPGKKNVINDILRELSELNNNILNVDRKNKYIRNRIPFLFGYNPNRRVSKEEYQKYVIFKLSINDILDDLGILPTFSGYTYIIDAVMIILDQSTYDIKLNNDVYPYIAYKYKLSSIGIVEHNIRTAIKSAYDQNLSEPGSNGMFIFSKRPSNKIFLFNLTEAVCDRMLQYPELLSDYLKSE